MGSSFCTSVRSLVANIEKGIWNRIRNRRSVARSKAVLINWPSAGDKFWPRLSSR